MYRKVSLEQLLKESDIVSLNITADESNRNFMNKEKFAHDEKLEIVDRTGSKPIVTKVNEVIKQPAGI